MTERLTHTHTYKHTHTHTHTLYVAFSDWPLSLRKMHLRFFCLFSQFDTSFLFSAECCRCSVAQLCPTLLDPVNCSMPNFPAFHHLLELAQTHQSVTPSNHLILCRPLLLLSSIFPSIRVFSNGSVLHIRWPKYWSFSFNIRPSNEHSGLISFRVDWFDLLAVQGTLKSLLQHHSSKASILRHSAFLIVPTLTSISDYWKNQSFDQMDLCRQSKVSAF